MSKNPHYKPYNKLYIKKTLTKQKQKKNKKSLTQKKYFILIFHIIMNTLIPYDFVYLNTIRVYGILTWHTSLITFESKTLKMH